MPPMSRRSLVTGAHLHFLKPRSSAIHRGRRTYVTTVVQYISGEFLDLAIALPYPLSWPPYASTIILTTVISRLVFTVPFSIWAKRRQWRLEEQVLPLLVQSRDELGKRIAGNLRREKIQRNRDELQKEFNNKFRAALSERRKELYKQFSCSPLPTMIVPAIAQLPYFIGCTILFGQLAQRPTPLDSEAFLTLTSLARPDSTASLPIALGLVTLANVETGQWLSSETKLAQARSGQVQSEKPKPSRNIPVKNAVQSGLRLFSIARIIVATMVDGSVLIFWLTSATFGLFQSWGLNWWKARRRLKMAKS